MHFPNPHDRDMIRSGVLVCKESVQKNGRLGKEGSAMASIRDGEGCRALRCGGGRVG